MIISLALALLALGLFFSVWSGHFRSGVRKLNISIWVGTLVLVLFLISLLNVLLSFSVIYMLGWPLIGIVLSVLGCCLAFSAAQPERIKFLAANLLLLVLSVTSIVAPN
jgi:hypothetical protein